MAKYFKNVKSYEDLKNQYKGLLKENHPDNGGDVSKMQEINVEYDALFKVWKDRKEAATGEKVQETADSTRSQFYTAFGWEGKNHDWSRSLKEIAVIVRAYVKEKYPTYKFSVRTSYASMCQELHVSLKEAPANIYKTFEELTDREECEVYTKAERNFWVPENGATREEIKAAYEEHKFLQVYDEVTAAMLADVDAFINSYNFKDCDGMTDYFHVDFYYFGCKPDDGLKIVPKTARIEKQASELAKAPEEPIQDEPETIEQKTGYTYKITKGEDTRDGSDLWIVRIVESLDKAAYIAENKVMKARGAYYSKFLHGFLFRFDPAEILKTS